MYQPILSFTLIALLTVGFGAADASEATQAPAAKPKTLSYGNLPLSFELNRGQTASEVDYLARGDGYVLYLTSGEAVLGLRQKAPSQPDQVPGPKAAGLADSAHAQEAVLRMKLVGAETKPVAEAIEALPGRTNYYRGQDPSKWLRDIPSFAKVRYSNVYPGIDVVYYGNQRQLEYDFVVAPGSSPSAIAMQFKGADHLQLNENGDLLVAVGEQQLLLQKPFLYQQIAATRKEVRGSYRLDAQGRIGFDVGAYDSSRELVIDPVFVYSTYIGGTGYDSPQAVAVDSQGQATLTGVTDSPDFPVTDVSVSSNSDGFVAKMNATGTGLLWATYVGGAGSDQAFDIALDASGDAYITGWTNSEDFPTTSGAFQELIVGEGVQAAFVTKLDDSTGAIIWATYVSGTAYVLGNGIAVDSTGRAYITGKTGSEDFPVTAGTAYQELLASSADAFFTVLTADGTDLDYSTYLGGSNPNDVAYAVAVDGAGNGYITGEAVIGGAVPFPTTPGSDKTVIGGISDAFVAKFNPAETGAASLIYSTFLGGDDAQGVDRAYSIAVDGSGNAYVAGHTDSSNFPTTVGAYQSAVDANLYAFVSKISADGTTLMWSTVFGDTACGADAQGLALDTANMVYITGVVGCLSENNFPIKNAADLQPLLGNGGACSNCLDVYVAKLDPSLSGDASLLWSTFLGGNGEEYPGGIAVDSAGDAYVVGVTPSDSTSFPLTSGAYDTELAGPGDGFVTKIGAGSAEPTTTVVSIQTVSPQYSDEVTLRATVTPIEVGSSELTGLVYFYVGASAVDCVAALPVDAVGSDAILEADDGVAEFDYAIEEAADSYVVTGCFFSDTANFADSANDESLVVTKENATVTPGGGNLNAYPVISGTVLSNFTLTFTVRETLPEPDENAGALAGEIGGAGLTVNLNGVGGSNKSAVCVDAAYTPGAPLLYTEQRVFTCSFIGVPVDAYEVDASVTGNYYIGSAYDVITVYNPAAGFVTGGGKFLYLEGSDRVNFGLVYNFIGKGKTVPKGNLLVIRRLANGDTCRLKSNGIGAAAVNGTTASFSGKGNYGCTHPDGSTYDGAGNQSILGWVQDNGQGSKATGPDRFWINTSAPNSQLAMPKPASTATSRPLTGGNIQVPQGK